MESRDRATARVRFHGCDGTLLDAYMPEVVFPILKHTTVDRYEAVGTGFFVSEYGLFFTAAHVLVGNDNTATLVVPQFLPGEHTFILRPITRAYRHERTDVAVALAQPYYRENTLIENRFLAVSEAPPRIGENVTSFGYPDRLDVWSERDQMTAVLLNPLSSVGTVIEERPNGLGSLYPGRLFDVALEARRGSSGSPVMDANGHAVALISMSLEEEDGFAIAHAAPLMDIFPVRIARTTDAHGKCTDITVRQLLNGAPTL